MRKAEFAIDTFPGLKLNGFTDNENSNGWACPYFEFEEADRIINAHKTTGQRAWFDENNDEFVFEVSGEIESYPAINNDGQKLYPIGYGVWIWEENND
jgi:hypothetical protein